MKLTPKQKEVIRKMREGWLIAAVFPMGGRPHSILFNKNEKVQYPYFSLIPELFVDNNGQSPFLIDIIPGTFVCELTDLGKTIPL